VLLLKRVLWAGGRSTQNPKLSFHFKLSNGIDCSCYFDILLCGYIKLYNCIRRGCHSQSVMIWSLCLILKSLCRLSPCDCLPWSWLFPCVWLLAPPSLCSPVSRSPLSNHLLLPVYVNPVRLIPSVASYCLVCVFCRTVSSWKLNIVFCRICRHLGPLSLRHPWLIMTERSHQ